MGGRGGDASDAPEEFQGNRVSQDAEPGPEEDSYTVAVGLTVGSGASRDGRTNLQVRMQARRFTRLTNAFRRSCELTRPPSTCSSAGTTSAGSTPRSA